MNDTVNQPLPSDESDAQTTGAGSCGEMMGTPCGICETMMAACKDVCSRFLDTRMTVNYHITTEIHNSQAQNKGKTDPQKKNEMVKEGNLEIRAIDLTVGIALICLVMPLISLVKRLS